MASSSSSEPSAYPPQNNKIWQDTHDSWKSRISYLHGKDHMSDCSFILNNGKNRIEIKSHRFVLGSCSSEFYNLYFLCGANLNEIIVTDVQEEALNQFVYFIYKETADLNLSIIWDVLKLAKTYSVQSLIRFCGGFLEKNITYENVFSILDKILNFDLPYCESKCMAILSQSSVGIYKNSYLCSISLESLKKLLSFDKLPGKEIEIYQAVLRWSEKFCEKNNQRSTTETKRFALGTSINLIRFCSMPIEEFNICTNDSILTKDEIIDVFRNIASGGVTESKFSSKKRQSDRKMGEIPVNSEISFCHLINPSFTFQMKDFLKFENSFVNESFITIQVNKPILFHGCSIYGRTTRGLAEQLEDEEVNISLYHNDFMIDTFYTNIKYDGTNKLYPVYLNGPVFLYPNKKYKIGIHCKGDYERYRLFVADNVVKVKNVNFKINYSYANFIVAILYENR